LKYYSQELGLSRKESVSRVSEELGVSRREVYQESLKIREKDKEEREDSAPRKG
jgi:hypothetical protein